MKNFEIFSIPNWNQLSYDGRRKIFRGISKYDFYLMKEKHWERALRKADNDFLSKPLRRRLLDRFAEIPYEYSGDGYDDFNMYQRPCSNGIGYVAICPGERGNNIYVDDPVLVKYLKAKYEKYLKQKSSANI